MKKIILLLFASILATIGFSQQFPLQSQYQFNYSSLNPAAVGENDFSSFRASFRSQWVGFSDKPIATQFVTLTRGFGNNGLGITLLSDKTGGAFSRSGLAISYSHKVIMAESEFHIGSQKIVFPESELFLGVSAGGAKVNFDVNTEDPAVLLNDDIVTEVTFGAYYKIKDFKIGISVPGLLNDNMEITNSKDNIIESHFYSMISYHKQLSSQWSIHPSILVKTTANHNQIDANINFKLKNKLWFGTSYRQDFGPTIYLGIDFGRLLSVYSYDISTNEMANYSNGSHEFTIGYDFIPLDELEKERREREEEKEFEKDKDKDGVEDKVDMCPDVYGDALAHGCPDSDKDGIPDKYDLCPNLYGTIDLQGCPELTGKEKEILSMALGNLKFDFDSDVIKYSSYPTLTNLTALLLSNPSMNIFIEGHASSEGTEQYNMALSASRVKAIQSFFVSKGVTKNRVDMDWEGETDPLNTNSNETERAENRRVEFDIKHHSKDSKAVLKVQEEYLFLLNKINIVSAPIVPVVAPVTVVVPSVSVPDEVLEVEQEIEETHEGLVEDSASTTDEFERVDTTVAEQETSIDEYQENEEDDSTIIIIDSIIPNIPSNNTEEEDDIVETNLDAENSDYLIIVQVFSDENNASNFVKRANEKLNYKFLNGKYYIYVFSSPNREEAVQFRTNYQKECWIKNP